MRQRLASADIAVEELLSGRFNFAIPSYQRDYAWSKDEAMQLVDDLLAAAEDVERSDGALPYFLGAMLMVVRNGDSSAGTASSGQAATPETADVVDGQQRLITLVILFSVLRDLADGEQAAALDRLIALPTAAGARRHQLELRSADNDFFRVAIQEPGATMRRRPEVEYRDRPARQNIEDVRRSLRQRFQKEFTDASRDAFARFLRQSARVLLVSSDDLDYAFQIFLTINDRGKRLSVEDIFRGEILGPLDPAQRQRYESVIDEMNKYVEVGERDRSKGKTFFSHLATIHDWSRHGIINGLKRAVQQRGGPRRFASDVFAPMAEVYLQAKGATTAITPSQEVEDKLEMLRWLERLGDDDWVPAAMLCLSRLRSDQTALTSYLTALDRFAHGLMALGCGRDARRRHYTPVLRTLASDDTLPAPEKVFAIAAGDQRQILRRIATRLYVEDPATAKLVLIRADHATSGLPSAHYRQLMDPSRPSGDRYTVEHVCPKGTVTEGEWADLFPTRARRTSAAECIGNLVLVTEVQNKRVSQKDFAAKKQVFFPDATPSPFRLTEVLRGETRWGPEEIERRYDLVMRTIKQMWALEGNIPSCPATRPRPTPKPT